MKIPMHVQGTIARAPFIAASCAALLLQYVMQFLVYRIPDHSILGPWNLSFRSPVTQLIAATGSGQPWTSAHWLLVMILAVEIAVAWLLLVLAIRRARAAGRSLLVACLAIVHMGPIPAPPAPPFRWGLAYPVSGSIQGSGVGAIRQGIFSTGVAYERVTEWDPARRLSFIVLSDPPALRELSPYRKVNAPHVSGYFRTLDARFTLTPLANGHTRLSLATRHELDLNPAFYWLPIAKWAIHANKARVLAHFAQQAEAADHP
jgi:hypothetical protein